MDYIRIPSFESYQRYKDRRPTWIKLLVEIIDQFDGNGDEKKFYKLPDQAKLTFILLLCLRANYTDKIPYPSEKWLKERLGMSTISLKPLIDTGLIVVETDIGRKPDGSATEFDKVGRNLDRSCSPETYKKERESEREGEGENDKCKIIFGHWNSQSQKRRWKTHTKLTPDIRDAVTDNLKRWPVEEICQAISNFAMILQGKEFLWTYDRWGLREFLARHEKDDRKTLQWIRFHPNNFREEDWLTIQARQARIQKQRDQEQRRRDAENFINEHRQWIMEAEPAVLLERCNRDPRMAFAVKKLRPEILSPEKT